MNLLKPLQIAFMITTLVAITAILGTSVVNLLSSIAVSVPEEMAFGIALLPANSYGCLIACLVAGGVRWVYDTHVKILFTIGT
jgi:hypothetical protein